MANKFVINLKSSDGKIFGIDESVAKQSKVIEGMLEVDRNDSVIIPMQLNTFPVEITSDVLIKVIEYCKRHAPPDAAGENSRLYQIDQPSSSKSSSSIAPAVDKLKQHVPAAAANSNSNSKLPEIVVNQRSSSESKSLVTVVEDLKTFDENFVKIDWNLLTYILMAANFLEIKGLFELTCQAAADHIKNKSPEDIRILFNIVNDFTPEEEEQIRRENAWAFQEN